MSIAAKVRIRINAAVCNKKSIVLRVLRVLMMILFALVGERVSEEFAQGAADGGRYRGRIHQRSE